MSSSFFSCVALRVRFSFKAGVVDVVAGDIIGYMGAKKGEG